MMLFVVKAEAQHGTSSPYSMYGVGLLTFREEATSSGLGHSGIAVAPSNWVNTTNPAALNKLDSLTFYFNMQFKAFYGHEDNGSETQSVYSANIDGVTMAFRCTKFWACAIGYNPYSTVGYNMNERKYIVGTETKYDINYTGKGGLSQAYINNSFTFFKHLTLGVSTSVLWGSITKTETAEFADAIGGENIYNTKKYTMNNMFFEYGLQYDFNIGRNNICIGGVFNEKTHLKSSYDHIVSNDVSSELFFDDVTPLIEDFYVPRSYGAGLSFSNERWLFTVDGRVNEWSKVTNSKFAEAVRFQDNWTAGGGMQYSAGKQGDPFYKRLKYRLGFFYGTDYLKLREVKLENYGMTAGLTIPLGRWNNALVLSYEYQKRGTTFNGMVEEKFQNFKVSMNIRETWFVKSKFD